MQLWQDLGFDRLVWISPSLSSCHCLYKRLVVLLPLRGSACSFKSDLLPSSYLIISNYLKKREKSGGGVWCHVGFLDLWEVRWRRCPRCHIGLQPQASLLSQIVAPLAPVKTTAYNAPFKRHSLNQLFHNCWPWCSAQVQWRMIKGNYW